MCCPAAPCLLLSLLSQGEKQEALICPIVPAACPCGRKGRTGVGLWLQTKQRAWGQLLLEVSSAWELAAASSM